MNKLQKNIFDIHDDPVIRGKGDSVVYSNRRRVLFVSKSEDDKSRQSSA